MTGVVRRTPPLVLALALALLSACGPDREDSVTPWPQTSPPPIQPPPGGLKLPPSAAECAGPPEFTRAAETNAASSRTLPWSPFGRQEVGWAVYTPKIAAEIGVACAAHDPGFAAGLARWQRGQGMPGDGILSSAVFDLMKARWHAVRPYVSIRGLGICPEPPPEGMLATATPAESFGGKTIQARVAALEAYRRMVAAAKAEDPAIAADPQALTIFSGYRSPEYDAERCAREGNCNGVTRASCSVHRTGLAFDVVVGAAPGYNVDNSADPNRLYMTRTPAYLWLVGNAHRFGFVNYVFEPWHWEWTGESIVAGNRPLGRGGTQRRFEPFPTTKETARDRQSPQTSAADPARRRVQPSGRREPG